MNKFEELFKKYNCDLNDVQVEQEVERILDEHLQENMNVDVYKQCLNSMDLTTLNGTDTEDQIYHMVQKVNNLQNEYPELPNVGAICVYPALISTVKENLTEDNIGIAAVSAGFPASQTFLEVKVAETAMAVQAGAGEIDVVISVGEFLSGNYEEVYEELTEIKAALRDARYKIILETGALKTASNIKKASILSLAVGPDYIKTSTGKIPVAATPFSAYVMCHAIKEWYEQTGEKIGYKPAGGIVATEDAVKQYTIVKEVLGEEWLNNKLFRIGASRLANNLLTSILGNETKYF